MKLIFSHKTPDKEGYYYYTDFGEHTPIILEVKRASDGSFWAEGGEFGFQIKPQEEQLEFNYDANGDLPTDKELWCYIPNPYLPGGKVSVKPHSY
jgi:hypothetical protein